MARPKKRGGRVTPKGTRPTGPRPAAPRVERFTLRPDQFAAGAAAAGVTTTELRDRALAAIAREEARRRLRSDA